MAVGKETMRIPPLDFGGPSCPRRGCWLIHSSSAHRWLDQAALVRAPRHPTGGPLAGRSSRRSTSANLPHHLTGRSSPFTYAQPSAHLGSSGSASVDRHIADWTDVPLLDFRI